MSGRGKTYLSKSYMWNVDDFLARGATGQVFMGYHRRNGEKVAVKMFTNGMEYGAMQREMAAIKKISDHENIVKFLEIDEREKNENHNIIVMELCNAGSLYEVIDSPENAYGLDEEQFKLVILHVSRGLSHLKKNGFVHRDIKPGNILRVKDVDGRYTFKLTDFGTARELGSNDYFTSLHGTEEYLYPAMYERVLNPRVRAQFRDKVDLWSVGATLFHVATGRLPFQPYHKRNDRQTMFKITGDKKSGMILGWQMQNGGEIFYSDELPPDINISNGIKAVITPVLAGLLENDFEKMWAFSYFFDYIEKISQLRVVDVFCVSTCSLIKVYLGSTDSLFDAINRQTTLSQQHMEFYHENIPLRPSRNGQLHLPITTPDSPVTVFGGPPQQSSKLETPALPLTPQPVANAQYGSLTDDLRYAKDSSKVAWSYMRGGEYLARTYKLMHQAANCLSETVKQENLALRKIADKVADLYDFALRQLESHIKSLQNESNVLQIMRPMNNDVAENAMRKIVEEIKSKQLEIARLAEDKAAALTQVHRLSERGNHGALMETDVFDNSMRKMKNYVDEIDSLFKKFQNDKKSKIGQDSFSKRVNDIRKSDISKRMQKATNEIDIMVKQRAEIYSRLYHLLANGIALREEIRGADVTLNTHIQQLQMKISFLDKWLSDHQLSMQSVYQTIVTRGDHQVMPTSHPPPPSSSSSLSGIVPQEFFVYLTNVMRNTAESTRLVDQQKNTLEQKLH